jgi:outer membrane protein assembly factor BamD (BamD/ComL family)
MHKKLTEWYDEETKDLSSDKYKRAIKKFQRYLDVNSNTNLIDNIKDELKLMFYNNRGKNMNILKDYIVTEVK